MATVTRLFDSHHEALNAVSDLEAAGISSDKISLVSNNADNWHDGHSHPDNAADGPLSDHDNRDSSVATGAGKGAATGGAVGAGAGVLAGLGMLAIPGLGPVVAAGWLASTAIGAVVGAAAGGAAGGLLGALKEAGHSDEEANVYAEGVRRGGTLVSVKAETDDEGAIGAILDGQRGFDAAVRGQAYRDAGWSGFDPQAAPYSTDDITRERGLYR
ncbi:hypothetical protein [Brevundimonas nasdae]|uniref:General stress protein 17M-like domain-containing protein n=1 Tax=Brevundimonas nasdae TaxID=172043 RepID=A0ABX8THH8_9CAUL|nr:hypothetical protein [Brevundimonas nasdae]QYC10688.1 hypothetical protein KWG56_01320 [Brevundimonas nasdae]QYC13475.1 hypothetical protein KWG63_14875 [Brevundimonas nasdae]